MSIYLIVLDTHVCLGEALGRDPAVW